MMYIGSICYDLGKIKDVSSISYIADDEAAKDTLAENRVEKYTKLDVSVAEASYSVLEKIIEKAQIDRSSIGAIVFTRICETNAEKLDEELDALLAKNGLMNVPVYQLAGGQCGSGALQLQFAENLINQQNLDNIVIMSSNVVEDPQKRNQVGNTVCLADGAIGFLVSKEPLEYEVVQSEIHYDHELRGLQASKDFSDSIRAFNSLSSGLKSMLSKIEAKNGVDKDEYKSIITSNSYNAVSQLKQVFRVPEDQIYMKNLPKWAHTFGSEIYSSLETSNSEMQYAAGDNILLYHCGYSAFGLTAIKKV